MRGNYKKFVYEDNNQTKVVSGIILKEDEYTYTIETLRDKETIIIGKRGIIKISNVSKGDFQ